MSVLVRIRANMDAGERSHEFLVGGRRLGGCHPSTGWRPDERDLRFAICEWNGAKTDPFALGGPQGPLTLNRKSQI
ncbi:MAG: hypothetical protein DME25_15405 [Verrucomicrobia bacterium]|nr:MAG: hypothetical protein DME25_15405 [Verrucomicrobiota bacterium]